MDLNCDLGEGEHWARTRALMDVVTSVNIACGGHAGTLESMRRCVRYAQKQGKRIGAHPGVPGNKGRGRASLSKDAFQTIILQQVASLERAAQAEGAQLHHVKLHGTLYHQTENSRMFAEAYLEVMEKYYPHLVVFARSGGRVAGMASRRGLHVWEEIFADRAYDERGRLRPRGTLDALLSEKEAILRLRHWMQTGVMNTVSGKPLQLAARTVCIHADTPGGLAMARAAARLIQEA